ncbi:hypothetical protein [Streptomyces sp. NPDC058674]|uniref:hypothetical protein n=1 Tax=Streptomyces sp. NPDC058674 TaxID=3346592 RepID=UPI0036686419
MPTKVADFLRTAEPAAAERAALDLGVTVRRGQGYTLRATAIPAIHRRPWTSAGPSTPLRRFRPGARPVAECANGVSAHEAPA